jgi:hypothetical protein
MPTKKAEKKTKRTRQKKDTRRKNANLPKEWNSGQRKKKKNLLLT